MENTDSFIFLTISSPPISAILAPFLIISIYSFDFIFVSFISSFEISLKTCLKRATGEITIFQDSDLEYDPEDYDKLINPIIANKADIVYGSRFLSNEKGQRILYYWHRVGNFLLTTLTNILTNINFTDMETGYKAFKTEVIKNINI